MRPAEAIDPLYAKTLRWAQKQGVEVLAYRAKLSSDGVAIDKAIPVDISASA
jgi:sugar fermentation stimulation protein A